MVNLLVFSWLQLIIMATDDPIILRWQVTITKRWSFICYQLAVLKKTVEPKLRSFLDDENEEFATAAAMMLKHIGARQSASGYEGEAEEAAK